jgi:glutamate N-acetyltransferase/amino-acid N-acetyltransferase
MKWIPGGVTAAEGFTASGVSAGIKRSRKPDLALVAANRPVAAAGVFTSNRIKAAPVLISKARLRRGMARAVLINSGCANCLTGRDGYADALTLGRALASEMGVAEREVLIASTGIIGRRLPISRMLRAIPSVVEQLNRAHHGAAAEAILTTDTRIKEAAVEMVISGRRVRIGGMAKGSGMIAPSMATMLCVLSTDAAVSPALLRMLLQAATARTFNQISVDGDMSTNDTVFALASGRSGLTIRNKTKAARAFADMLHAVAERLARLIVHDGEGASKIMEVDVVGARSDKEAQSCAQAVALSPLVKTMLAGGDPNVGRIASAVGASGASFDPDRLDIRLGATPVVRDGVALRVGKGLARQLLNRPTVHVRIDLHGGRGHGRMMSCDLTEEYVRINARYST